MDKLRFAPAGIPHCYRDKNTIETVSLLPKLGLDAMELEFVRSVNISEDKAPLVRKAAQDNDIVLTCHAPYFVNLNSLEKPKLEASKQRIIKSAKILSLCGGWSACFHPGFYMKSTKEEAYERVKKAITELSKKVYDIDKNLWLRPETTGKPTQFGDLQEILKLSAEFDNVMPCIDFAHFHARTNGKYNSLAEFRSIFEDVEKILGRKGLDNVHLHITGIEYGEKGEKHHLTLKESDLKWKELIKAMQEFKVKGVAVSESPNIEADAMMVKKEFYG